MRLGLRASIGSHALAISPSCSPKAPTSVDARGIVRSVLQGYSYKCRAVSSPPGATSRKSLQRTVFSLLYRVTRRVSQASTRAQAIKALADSHASIAKVFSTIVRLARNLADQHEILIGSNIVHLREHTRAALPTSSYIFFGVAMKS